jgi:hypothetical protein
MRVTLRFDSATEAQLRALLIGWQRFARQTTPEPLTPRHVIEAQQPRVTVSGSSYNVTLGTIDATDLHLIHTQMVRSFGDCGMTYAAPRGGEQR